MRVARGLVCLGFVGVVLTLGCDDDDDDDDAPEAAWSVLGEGLEGGALLGARSVGGALYFVGGQLDGSEGAIVRLDEAGGCVERMAAPRLLWWIHGASADTWYAVGHQGQIIRSSGGVRTDESVATEATFYGVWDAGDVVYAVGGDVRGSKQGEVWIRRDGAWSLLAGELPGVLFKVWRDWVVGDGVAYRIVGDSLEAHPPPDGARLLTVVGRGDDDVWAVGGAQLPTVLRWDGSAWSKIEFSPFCGNQGLNGVWTAPGEDVWVTGFHGAMARFDGTEWVCPRPAPTREHMHVIIGHEGEVYAAGGNLLHPNEASVATITRHGAGERTVSDLSVCEGR